jgi:hypothetical protein
MGVKISADKVAWSSIYGYSPQREGADQCWRWCVEAYGGGRAWLDTVEAYYFWNYFVPYTDSIKAATGCILFNYPPHLNGIPVAYRRDLWRAWEERNGIITVWRDSSARGRAGEIIEVGCEAETPVVAAVGTRQTGRKALAQLQIIPQPAPAGGELTLQWKQGQTTVVEEVRLYDGVGRLLGSLWQGVWQPPLPLVLKLPAEVSAGQYWLVLRTQRGWEIAPLQIVKSSP